MTQSLNHRFEHTTDSYFAVDEKKKGRCEGLVKDRRAGLARSRSMIITLEIPDGKKCRRGNLTFSNSLSELSRAGTSRRHLVTDESEEAFSNCVRELSSAGTSRRHLVTEKKKGRCEGLVKDRRAGLARSRSMIITLESPDGKKSRRGHLTFSNSLRELSRAGTSRRHLVTDESEEAFSNCVGQLSRARTSRRHLVTDDAKQRQ
jgi:hypothetical protein